MSEETTATAPNRSRPRTIDIIVCDWALRHPGTMATLRGLALIAALGAGFCALACVVHGLHDTLREALPFGESGHFKTLEAFQEKGVPLFRERDDLEEALWDLYVKNDLNVQCKQCIQGPWGGDVLVIDQAFPIVGSYLQSRPQGELLQAAERRAGFWGWVEDLFTYVPDVPDVPEPSKRPTDDWFGGWVANLLTYVAGPPKGPTDGFNPSRWYRVRLPNGSSQGKTGWVPASYVALDPPSTPLPFTFLEATLLLAVASATFALSGAAVRLRLRTSRNSRLARRLDWVFEKLRERANWRPDEEERNEREGEKRERERLFAEPVQPAARTTKRRRSVAARQVRGNIRPLGA